MDCDSANGDWLWEFPEKKRFLDERTLEEGRMQSEGRIRSDQNLREGKITGLEGSTWAVPNRWLWDDGCDFTNLWDSGRSESPGI
jgi:hypothetical protein